MAKEPKAPAAKPTTALVDVLLPIDVDGVRYAPGGDAVEIRAELVDALVAAGAVALSDAPAE